MPRALAADRLRGGSADSCQIGPTVVHSRAAGASLTLTFEIAFWTVRGARAVVPDRVRLQPAAGRLASEWLVGADVGASRRGKVPARAV